MFVVGRVFLLLLDIICLHKLLVMFYFRLFGSVITLLKTTLHTVLALALVNVLLPR